MGCLGLKDKVGVMNFFVLVETGVKEVTLFLFCVSLGHNKKITVEILCWDFSQINHAARY